MYIFIRLLLHKGSKCAGGSHKTQVGYENNGLVTELVGYKRSTAQLRETIRSGTCQGGMEIATGAAPQAFYSKKDQYQANQTNPN